MALNVLSSSTLDVATFAASSNEAITDETEYSTSISISVSDKGEDDYPSWVVVFDRVQLCFTLAGFLANSLTLVTLARNHKGFSRLVLMLLRHQSLVDCWVCGMATLVILQPFHWLTGVHHLDVLICHAWHGQAFYWGAVTLSTYNLVLLSGERFLAVCVPLKYNTVSHIGRGKIAAWFVVLYIVTLIVTHGTYIQTKLAGGDCVNEYAFSGAFIEKYFFAFVIFTYLTTYLLPVIMMIILYALVVRTLARRGKDDKLGHSQVIDRASSQLTKTAIAVTAVFIFSIGYDLHYYLLGYTGVVEYELNTPIQKTGVFLSNINSVANPFIYGLLMPLYRRSLAKTLRCYKKSGNNEEYSMSESGGGNTLSTIT